MNYPQGTEDLLQQLIPGHGSGDFGHGAGNNASNDVPGNSYGHAAEHAEPAAPDHAASASAGSVDAQAHPIVHDDLGNQVSVPPDSKMGVKKILKTASPYVAVFVLALCFYLLFFTNLSLKTITQSIFKSTPKSSQQAVKKTVYPNLDAYNTWIRSYFFSVTDQSILDPDYDISGNGLTNYQKFILGVDPTRKDTLGLGVTDTESIINGINPSTGLAYTDDQKKLIAQYVDLEAASNRLSLAIANSSTQQVAGATIGGTYDLGNGMGTTGSNSNFVSTNTVNNERTSNLPNAGGPAVNQGYNAQLDIPSLKISVPLIWSQDAKNFDTDLQNGVVHYPGTALPGEIGTAYISGHSSNYAWAKGKYNQIFAKLGDLKQYDSFTITATDTNGQKVIYHYVITGSQIYKADDQAQFANQNKSLVALSTCWPVGTSSKRLVVFGQLSQVER